MVPSQGKHLDTYIENHHALSQENNGEVIMSGLSIQSCCCYLWLKMRNPSTMRT